MRNETRPQAEALLANDYSISVGVSCLCQESSDLLRDAAITVHSPQIRQTLSEIAMSRASLLRQLNACAEENPSCFDFATDLVQDGRTNYQRIRSQLGELSDKQLLEALYLADVSAAHDLREAVKAVSNTLIACLLSSAVATFQISSDKLRSYCSHMQVQH